MTNILDGKKVRIELKKVLIEKIKNLSMRPHLVIIQVGNRADSNAYIIAKKKFAIEIGAQATHIVLPETIVEKEIIQAIKVANVDASVHGIIIQLPLPSSIDKDQTRRIINTINPTKDVDGLTDVNIEKWSNSKVDAIWPATTRGIRELLYFYGISLKGKRVAMIGRSALVGKPTSAMCEAEGAEVTICHSKTERVPEITRMADIIIVAIGKPHFINANYVRSGQVVVDVGMTSVNGVLTGDVDYDAVAPVLGHNGFITPVPGGVGQMTVLALFENLSEIK